MPPVSVDTVVPPSSLARLRREVSARIFGAETGRKS